MALPEEGRDSTIDANTADLARDDLAVSEVSALGRLARTELDPDGGASITYLRHLEVTQPNSSFAPAAQPSFKPDDPEQSGNSRRILSRYKKISDTIFGLAAGAVALSSTYVVFSGLPEVNASGGSTQSSNLQPVAIGHPAINEKGKRQLPVQGHKGHIDTAHPASGSSHNKPSVLPSVRSSRYLANHSGPIRPIQNPDTNHAETNEGDPF